MVNLESSKIGKRISRILWTSAIALMLLCLPVLAQEKINIYHIQITHDTSGLRVTPCPFPGIPGDIWRFTNSTSDTVYLHIFACAKQNPSFYYLAGGDSVDHVIGISDGLMEVLLLRTGELGRCYREHIQICPTLTPCGVVVLVGLITSSAIFIMLRRRKVTVST
jgi:hypothetical protein